MCVCVCVCVYTHICIPNSWILKIRILDENKQKVWTKMPVLSRNKMKISGLDNIQRHNKNKKDRKKKKGREK